MVKKATKSEKEEAKEYAKRYGRFNRSIKHRPDLQKEYKGLSRIDQQKFREARLQIYINT